MWQANGSPARDAFPYIDPTAITRLDRPQIPLVKSSVSPGRDSNPAYQWHAFYPTGPPARVVWELPNAAQHCFLNHKMASNVCRSHTHLGYVLRDSTKSSRFLLAFRLSFIVKLPSDVHHDLRNSVWNAVNMSENVCSASSARYPQQNKLHKFYQRTQKFAWLRP